MSHRRATPRPARRPRRARPLRTSTLTVAGLFAGLAIVPGAALAGSVEQAQLIRSGSAPGSQLGDGFGGGTAPVALGDVNGDRRDDFAARVRTSEAGGSAIRVVFGSPTNRYPDLDRLGTAGFTIRSSSPGSEQLEMKAARDFDGDGLRDILVSDDAGTAVVHGERSGADVDIAAGGSRVTRFEGRDRRAGTAQSIGDFDGDGRDDLVMLDAYTSTGNVIVLGGPRATTLTLGSGTRTVRIPAPKSCSTTFWWWFVPVCQYPPDGVIPVGDLNGDGRTDLIVVRGLNSGVAAKSVVLFGRAAAGGTTFDLNTPTGPYAAYTNPISIMTTDLGYTDAPGVDLNGDGLADLFGYRLVGSDVQYGFSPGRAGTGTVDAGSAFQRAPWTAQFGDFTPGPLLAGNAVLPVGDLDGDGDREGLASWTTWAEDSTEPAHPRGAIVLYADGPDRVAPVLAPRLPLALDAAGLTPGFRPAAFKAGTGASYLRALVLEDLPLTLIWKDATTGQTLKTETTGSKVERSFDGAIDGRALPAGRYEVEVSATDAAGNRSTQTLPFEILPGGADPSPDPVPQTVGPLSQWKTNGAAKQLPDGSVELTSATPTVHGEVYWPIPITKAVPVTTIEFEAEMTGGSPAGGGMTLAVTKDPPGQGGITPGTGSSLGFAPRTGLAVALQTYRAMNSDPSANFVGMAFGERGSRPVSLKWFAVKPLTESLRNRTLRVRVELTPSTRKIWIDDVFILGSGGDFPAGYLQFTASTGPNQNQRHVVRNVKVTQTAAEPIR